MKLACLALNASLRALASSASLRLASCSACGGRARGGGGTRAHLDFSLELGALGDLGRLGLEEVLRALRTHLRHIHVRRQLREPLRLQLAPRCLWTMDVCASDADTDLAEDEQELTEADLAVVVLVDLSNHGLERHVCLRGVELLHHVLELHQVEEAVLGRVVQLELLLVAAGTWAARTWHEHLLFDLLAAELGELGVDRDLDGRRLDGLAVVDHVSAGKLRQA